MDLPQNIKVQGESLIITSFADIDFTNSIMQNYFSVQGVHLIKGQIQLLIESPQTEVNYDSLTAYSENPVIDICVAMEIPEHLRKAYVIFHYGATISGDKVANQRRGKILITLAKYEYLYKGSFQNLAIKGVGPTKFLQNGFKLSKEDVRPEVFTTHPSFFRAKMSGLLRKAPDLLKKFNREMVSRFQLSHPGGRVLRIFFHVHSHCDMTKSGTELFKFLASNPDTFKRASVAMHPDHPHNPMQNSSKYFLSTLGYELKKRGGVLDKLFEEAPQTYLPSNRASMSSTPALMAGNLPTIENMTRAFIDPFLI
jgi:hypothetical protein